MLALGLVGLTPRYADTRRLSEILVLLTGFGLLFSLWLTWLELFVIHAICQWCVISAILATILFIVSWLDLRELTQLAEVTAEEAAERLRDGRFGKELRNTSEVALRAIRKE